VSHSRTAILQSLLRQGVDAFAFCLRSNCEFFVQLWRNSQIELARKTALGFNSLLRADLKKHRQRTLELGTQLRCPARSMRREAATCCCVSATSNLLADELVILAMRPDPKPMYAAWHRETKSAVIETDSSAMKSTICNSLEMQGWMTWICLELREISVRYGLNFNRQCVEALPKPL
jgi:hypothetical protein